ASRAGCAARRRLRLDASSARSRPAPDRAPPSPRLALRRASRAGCAARRRLRLDASSARSRGAAVRRWTPMTVLSRSWGNLTTLGKVVLPLALLVFIIAPILTILLALFAGPLIVDILTANLPIVRFVVAVTAVLLMSVPSAFL